MRAILFVVVSLFYCLGFFPFAYFRGDDWLIIGNSNLILPKDWGFLFRPTLFFGRQELDWFFRPGFKLLSYALFQTFHFHYWAWLAFVFSTFWLALWIGQRLCRRMNGPVAANVFFCLAAVCVHAQMGSLLWIGEGLMNVPQLVLLVACASAFLHADRWRGSSFTAWLCFVLALAFKESSVIFLVWLASAWWFHPQFQPQNWRKRILPLLPMAITALVYLVVRLLCMPITSGYHPVWTWGSFGIPMGLFVGALSIPVLAFYLLLKGQISWCSGAVLSYGSFFLAWLAPHLGHPFFSPGWLLIPVVFFLLTLSMHIDFEVVGKGFAARFQIAVWGVFLVAAVPTLYNLHEVDWWTWRHSQRQIIEIFRSADAKAIDKIWISDCAAADRPEVTFPRVIGHDHGIEFLWQLLHSRPVEIRTVWCKFRRELEPNERQYQWDFPKLTPIARHKPRSKP